MKRLIIIPLVLATLLAAAPASHATGVFATWWDAKDLDTGYGFGLRYDFGVSPLVAVDGRVSWVRFSEAQNSTNAFPFELSVRAGDFFYGGGGLGMYVFNPEQGDTFSDFSGFLSAGVNAGKAGVGLFAEVRYLFIKPETNGVKIDASGIALAAGAIFSL